jgi:stage IV sporulation protein FB
MNERGSLLYWSIPCGSLFATRIRVSVFFPLVLIVICYWLQSLSLGLLFGTILFLSVLLHEFGHVFAARATGGQGEEILLWPLGGLAFVQPPDRLGAKLFVAAAGPLVNLSLCLATFWPVYQAGKGTFAAAIHPLQFPALSLSAETLLSDLAVIVFVANWLPLLVNLIPVYPLDGGQMVHATLAEKMGPAGTGVYLRIGFVVAIVAMFAGLMFDNATVVLLGSFVLMMNVQESMQHRLMGESYDESFMGYDFSQGYTSLERSATSDTDTEIEARPPKQPGPLARWRARRKAEREERQRAEEAAAAERLDSLLAKVQAQGIASLTTEERRFLEQTSQRIRQKGKSRDV